MNGLPVIIALILILSLFIFFLYIFLQKKIYKDILIKKFLTKNTIREYEKQINLYLYILNNLSDGLTIVDKDKNILFVNPAFKDNVRSAAFPYSIKKFEFLIRNFEINSLVDNIINKDNLDSIEKRVSYFDKANEKTVNCKVFKIKDTEKYAVIVRDVTYLQKIENIRATFIQNISHEVKTPITAIMGFVETLKNGAMDNHATGIKFLDIIEHHTKRLNYLIDDLITLTKIETGRAQIKLEKINIKSSVEHSLSLFEKEIKEKKIDIVKNIGNGLFISDFSKINQIIINLIQNAVKYTEKGGIIKIEGSIQGAKTVYNFIAGVEEASVLWDNLSRAETLKEFFFFSIEDTGIGVSYTNLLRLGERFFRVNSSHTTEYKGTGLGLAIIKHTLKLLNGAAVLKSSLGNGFMFTFMIPLSQDYINIKDGEQDAPL
ncbi:MAG: HAMP domain-containing sensor histidine kinase [Deltaproteobacteria bacterium]|nr:HAMP domain-containing sensor histidine kinase [Deltaproteobacteria bacterium]